MNMTMTVVAGAIALTMMLNTTQAAEQKTVKLGLSPAYAPFESKTPDGKLVGFDIDIGNEVCKRIQAHCVWVEMSFDGLIPALVSKKIDIINSSMNITEKRQKSISFTNPVYIMPIQLVARKNSGLLPTVESLKGKSVGVQQGTTQEDYAKAHWANAGVNVVTYQDQDQVFMDLSAGRLDGAVQESQTAQQAFLSKDEGKEFGFAGDSLKDPVTLGQGTGMGLRQKDTELQQQVNNALNEMKKDGTLLKLSAKYFNRNIIAE